MLVKKLLVMLVCAFCIKDLFYDLDLSELVCLSDLLAFPIREGIPVMLENEARGLKLSDREKYQ